MVDLLYHLIGLLFFDITLLYYYYYYYINFPLILDHQ